MLKKEVPAHFACAVIGNEMYKAYRIVCTIFGVGVISSYFLYKVLKKKKEKIEDGTK